MQLRMAATLVFLFINLVRAYAQPFSVSQFEFQFSEAKTPCYELPTGIQDATSIKRLYLASGYQGQKAIHVYLTQPIPVTPNNPESNQTFSTQQTNSVLLARQLTVTRLVFKPNQGLVVQKSDTQGSVLNEKPFVDFLQEAYDEFQQNYFTAPLDETLDAGVDEEADHLNALPAQIDLLKNMHFTDLRMLLLSSIQTVVLINYDPQGSHSAKIVWLSEELFQKLLAF
jgi:hypothetical protein